MTRHRKIGTYESLSKVAPKLVNDFSILLSAEQKQALRQHRELTQTTASTALVAERVAAAEIKAQRSALTASDKRLIAVLAASRETLAAGITPAIAAQALKATQEAAPQQPAARVARPTGPVLGR